MPGAEFDREAVYARLSAHAAADHIDLAELERRIAAVADAATYGEALEVLADLPALPTSPGVGGSPVSGRPRWGQGHGDADRPRDNWIATAERFRDPKTGRVMRVWEDVGGGRHYVADE